MHPDTLLAVEGLSICFNAGAKRRAVVEDVSFSVARGKTVALVGESGSGKTLTAKALVGLIPRGALVTKGHAWLARAGDPLDLVSASDQTLREIRGRRVAMIFQEPMSALSPLHTVGAQVAEVLTTHGLSGDIKARVLNVFAEVGFPDPERAWRAYPFELSGGLRQRAVIAMAMVGDPDLVIADEPTTALDVTTQAMVLDLLARLQRERGLSVLLITHDLGVVANMAERIVVMRRGRVVEAGPARAVLTRPGHGYTRALMEAAPHLPHQMICYSEPKGDPILDVTGLSKTFAGRARTFGPPGAPIQAVADFEMRLERGKTVAVVGESGSGKSTVAKLILRALTPDPGARILFRGRDGVEADVCTMGADALKAFRRRAQMVFQDPYSALSPRLTVQDILTEPLEIHGIGDAGSRRARAAELMALVGLPEAFLGRFPHAFSGGQRQRIAIARALALTPELLVCDEPTSALDVSVQAEVLGLLAELKRDLGLSYLFISHDLAVVARIADRVLVMRRGRVIEQGSADCIFNDARHPYTRALLAASPEADLEHRLDLAAVAAGAGEPESWPAPFRYQGETAPPMVPVSPGHFVRCAA